MKIKLKNRYTEIGQITTFVFENLEKVIWEAGQYLNVVMQDVSPVEADRLFTIASAPHESDIMITTIIGSSPYKKRLDALKIGDIVEADQLGGDFVWNEDGKDKLFIAGGIGSTPYRSIVLDNIYKKRNNNAVLLYAGGKGRRPFLDEFLQSEHVDKTFNVYHYEKTRLSVKRIIEDVPDYKMMTVYIAGSQLFSETIGRGLSDLGLPRESLKYDWFDGYDSLEYN